MTKTEHYNLNQWEKTDRVLMEDFNTDNAKIDAAIAEAKAAIPYVKIKELTLSAAAATADLDVSDVDFSQYMKVELFVQCPQSLDGIYIRVNNLTENYTAISLSGTGATGAKSIGYLAYFRGYGYGVLEFYTPVPQGNVGCVSITYNGSSSCSGQQYMAPCTWSALSSFNFSVSSSKLPIGTHIALFGVRK